MGYIGQWRRSRALIRCAVSAAAVIAAVITAVCGSAGPAAAASRPGWPQTRQPADIVTVPTRTAHTAEGEVAYREVGQGPPIVLITGYGASMDDWDPGFVDSLAAHHTVVVFDNAGVGQTDTAPSPLTISAMADQTSALMSSLRLHRSAVLGWSMGGMIAQALAVRHPGKVGQLVLAATQAGTGRSLAIPSAAAAALDSPNPAVVLSALFPADQSAAARAYAADIVEYPGFYQASASVKAAQSAAIQQWMAGDDPAGRQVGRIRVPVLVADGASDELDPAQNAAILAESLHRASVALYPDAGHAFLFQDAAEFIPSVDRFLR